MLPELLTCGLIPMPQTHEQKHLDMKHVQRPQFAFSFPGAASLVGTPPTPLFHWGLAVLACRPVQVWTLPRLQLHGFGPFRLMLHVWYKRTRWKGPMCHLHHQGTAAPLMNGYAESGLPRMRTALARRVPVSSDTDWRPKLKTSQKHLKTQNQTLQGPRERK